MRNVDFKGMTLIAIVFLGVSFAILYFFMGYKETQKGEFLQTQVAKGVARNQNESGSSKVFKTAAGNIFNEIKIKGLGEKTINTDEMYYLFGEKSNLSKIKEQGYVMNVDSQKFEEKINKNLTDKKISLFLFSDESFNIDGEDAFFSTLHKNGDLNLGVNNQTISSDKISTLNPKLKGYNIAGIGYGPFSKAELKKYSNTYFPISKTIEINLSNGETSYILLNQMSDVGGTIGDYKRFIDNTPTDNSDNTPGEEEEPIENNKKYPQICEGYSLDPLLNAEGEEYNLYSIGYSDVNESLLDSVTNISNKTSETLELDGNQYYYKVFSDKYDKDVKHTIIWNDIEPLAYELFIKDNFAKKQSGYCPYPVCVECDIIGRNPHFVYSDTNKIISRLKAYRKDSNNKIMLTGASEGISAKILDGHLFGLYSTGIEKFYRPLVIDDNSPSTKAELSYYKWQEECLYPETFTKQNGGTGSGTGTQGGDNGSSQGGVRDGVDVGSGANDGSVSTNPSNGGKFKDGSGESNPGIGIGNGDATVFIPDEDEGGSTDNPLNIGDIEGDNTNPKPGTKAYWEANGMPYPTHPNIGNGKTKKILELIPKLAKCTLWTNLEKVPNGAIAINNLRDTEVVSTPNFTYLSNEKFSYLGEEYSYRLIKDSNNKIGVIVWSSNNPVKKYQAFLEKNPTKKIVFVETACKECIKFDSSRTHPSSGLYPLTMNKYNSNKNKFIFDKFQNGKYIKTKVDGTVIEEIPYRVDTDGHIIIQTSPENYAFTSDTERVTLGIYYEKVYLNPNKDGSSTINPGDEAEGF